MDAPGPAPIALSALAPPDGPALSPPLPWPATVIPAQARSDEHLVALWLHGRSGATQRAYAADLAAFFGHVQRSLHAVTLGDMQGFQDRLKPLATSTESAPAQRREVAALLRAQDGFCQVSCQQVSPGGLRAR